MQIKFSGEYYVINCKLYQNDQDKVNFDVEIVGKSEDVLIELMKINEILIRKFRGKGIPDELIEKQLVNCIVAGFDMDDLHKRN